MRPGLARQSRMRSQTIAKKPIRVTPAFSMRRLASSASLTSKVPLASVLAKTSYPSSMSDRARNAVPNHNVIRAGISHEEEQINLQTSVTIPPMISCFLPRALTALRKSALSQALTSPWRRMKVALGCISVISLSRRPLGPPSEEEVRIVGRSKMLPMEEWASMLLRKSLVPKSRTSWARPTWWSMTKRAWNLR